MSGEIPSYFNVLFRAFSRPTLLLAALVVAPVIAKAVSPVADPVESQVEVENAKNSFPGIVNSNSVYVRCGPAESYYPTMKLDKGARVTVVGMKLEWLKIIPPDGSFCYISKAFVDRNGDGSAGKVNKDAVNVRAGSTLNTLKVVPLCQLSIGMDVKILGEQDEYYKITPPEGKAFVYVNKQFVMPDPEAKPEPIGVKPDGGGLVKEKTSGNNEVPQVNPPLKPETKPEVAHNDAKPMEKPLVAPPATTQSGEIATSSTKPVDDQALVEAMFDKAEAEFVAANAKPLDEQPLAALMSQYEPLAISEKLPNTLHRIAETRLATLKTRSQAATELANTKAVQEQMRKKQVALQAERKELEDRLAASGIAIYTAVGELQPSSLQLGSKTLYRLTDPANGRTVCYLRTDDVKVLNQMGKFIGVKGELTTEPQLSLKVLIATDVAVVEQAKVNHGVTATVVPPSMLAADDASTAAHLDARP